MSRDIDDLRHPEWSVPDSGSKSGLKALHEAFDAHFASDKKNRDAAIAAWNAVHDGDLVHRSVVDSVADRDAEWEPLRAKHAALVKAAKAVRVKVGVLYDHQSGWKCSICGGTAYNGHLPSCAWYRFLTALADLEASDEE